MSGEQPRRDSRWWGWGDPAADAELDQRALDQLSERIGVLEPGSRPAAAEDVRLPEPAELPASVRAAVGEAGFFNSVEDRLRHATGRGYVDLARLRSGALEAAPDAVVLPADAERVSALLEACSAEGVAVVPFGGGTSVVGGVEPLRGPHRTPDQPRPRSRCGGSRSTAAR